ncbi:hypothetical protein [Fructilactobacillus cliffordii]|uniref:CD-NTase associated protein 4-like DNA endonuclease domain-containing protein n=1 Tax=Fructilactobacillus cliffordii TaxID=2940299 RepID=A0A9Q8ZU02_9LACO|nr:hypothetical protein [Fructilactobacillus cliffordii]USS89385.1 hypothetical protein M3M40_00840 [Fructilactobacillus cliffordii]
MSGNNASSTKKGFNYQDVAAVFFMFNYIKELISINDEGIDDIDLILKDKTIFIQTKHSDKYPKASVANVFLQKTLVDLVNNYIDGHKFDEIFYISNLYYPLGNKGKEAGIKFIYSLNDNNLNDKWILRDYYNINSFNNLVDETLIKQIENARLKSKKYKKFKKLNDFLVKKEKQILKEKIISDPSVITSYEDICSRINLDFNFSSENINEEKVQKIYDNLKYFPKLNKFIGKEYKEFLKNEILKKMSVGRLYYEGDTNTQISEPISKIKEFLIAIGVDPSFSRKIFEKSYFYLNNSSENEYELIKKSDVIALVFVICFLEKNTFNDTNDFCKYCDEDEADVDEIEDLVLELEDNFISSIKYEEQILGLYEEYDNSITVNYSDQKNSIGSFICNNIEKLIDVLDLNDSEYESEKIKRIAKLITWKMIRKRKKLKRIEEIAKNDD